MEQPPAGPGWTPPAQQPSGYPPYGYAPPPPAPPVPGSAWGYPPNSDEKTWAWLSHGGFVVGGFIVPLVIMLTKGKESPFVRRHAVEALNWQISAMIYFVVSFVLMLLLIGFLLIVALIVCVYVFGIVAIVKASGGQDWRYPACIRLVS